MVLKQVVHSRCVVDYIRAPHHARIYFTLYVCLYGMCCMCDKCVMCVVCAYDMYACCVCI